MAPADHPVSKTGAVLSSPSHHFCFALVYSFVIYIEADFSLSLCHRLIHGGQFLNGLAGPTIMSAGPFLSTTWFGPDQRATATAVATLFSYLGGAASFLVGPLVVPAPNDTLAAGRLAAVAVSNSSIRGRIQLVMYAGTIDTQGPPPPPGPRRIDGTSFRHHVITVEGHKHNQAIGFKQFPQFIIFTSASETLCRLVGLSCLTGSEN